VESSYDTAIAAAERRFQSHARVLGAERAQAPARLAELLPHSTEQRRLLIWNHPGFRTWGFFELLAETVRERTFEQPAAAEELAFLALQLADLLDADYYGVERIQDLRARLWGYAGNIRRTMDDLRAAEEAFQTAFELLRTGTGDLLERAILSDLQASLRREQGRCEESLRLLARARHIYERVGETHRVGRVLVKMSTVHEHMGTPEKAIPLLFEALPKIDVEREPRLLLNAQHNLSTYLADAGRCLEAQRVFLQTRPLYARFPENAVRHRRRALAGKIARGLGRMQEAEECLAAARAGYIADGKPFDAAFISLELASLYAELGRTAELARAAEETLPIFASRQSYPRALAALALLHRIAADKRAGLGVAVRAVAYLKRLSGHLEAQ
jgi:tetratricopeptide (TPR) repeat protein